MLGRSCWAIKAVRGKTGTPIQSTCSGCPQTRCSSTPCLPQWEASRCPQAYNDHDASLRVEDLQLADGSSSAYRLNVNGSPVQDLDIPLETLSLLPGDSMYVFVEVTVDPISGAGATPFWVRDAWTFVTNGNVQEVKLLARGQNAVFHGGPNQYTTLACDEVWTAELPHVIYGRVLVDPGCTLTILPGAEVYSTRFGHLGEGRNLGGRWLVGCAHPVPWRSFGRQLRHHARTVGALF